LCGNAVENGCYIAKKEFASGFLLCCGNAVETGCHIAKRSLITAPW
jgi:hypothetical protein